MNCTTTTTTTTSTSPGYMRRKIHCNTENKIPATLLTTVYRSGCVHSYIYLRFRFWLKLSDSCTRLSKKVNHYTPTHITYNLPHFQFTQSLCPLIFNTLARSLMHLHSNQAALIITRSSIRKKGKRYIFTLTLGSSWRPIQVSNYPVQLKTAWFMGDGNNVRKRHISEVQQTHTPTYMFNTNARMCVCVITVR